jgi:hypothetical protein
VPVTASVHPATNPGQLFLRAILFLFSCSAVASNCPHATILVNVFNRDLKVQSDLQATDLNVELDRRRVQVHSLLPDNRPRRIVLMVDTSGSMEASQRHTGWGIALPAAAYAVDVVPASASVALVTFSDMPRQESTYFESPKVVGAKVLDLNRRQPQGATRLFDSIHQVLVGFTELHSGDAIYVVTDGGDNKSRISQVKLRQELIARGVRLFAFLVLRPTEAQTEEEVTGSFQVGNLAEFTGGDVVPISAAEIAGPHRAQLDKLAKHIVGEVENVYRVELEASSAEKAARVKVSFVDRDRKKSGQISYTHEIAPCPSENAVD